MQGIARGCKGLQVPVIEADPYLKMPLVKMSTNYNTHIPQRSFNDSFIAAHLHFLKLRQIAIKTFCRGDYEKKTAFLDQKSVLFLRNTHVRDDIRMKKCLNLDIAPITQPPTPQFGQLYRLFLPSQPFMRLLLK